MRKLTAFVLALCLMLTGCVQVDFQGLFAGLGYYLLGTTTSFEDMSYESPDITELKEVLLDAIDSLEDGNVDATMDVVYDFYRAYWQFYTAYSLAYIHYCQDMTDNYWSREYRLCLEDSTQVDAALDELLYAIGASSMRQELEQEDFFGEGFFDDYQGESIWDDTFTALMEQENELINRYYTLSDGALEDGSSVSDDLQTLFVELVKVRRELAAYLGYDSYVDFAYIYHYDRDYTPAMTRPYLEEIRRELVPLYRSQDRLGAYAKGEIACAEGEMLAFVRQAVREMGGTAAQAFQVMEEAKVYDITYSDKKYDASFEIYIYNYDVPFVFVNPQGNQWDKLTLAHEFGHFANDYTCMGSTACVDVAEFFSQGMEYLTLSYGNPNKTLVQMKMVDSLLMTVEQAAYAAFEHQVYDLPEEELNEQALRELFQAVCDDYGLDSWGIEGSSYVSIPHFFTHPLYVISYVVSNDAAFQLYQLEQTQPGEGLKLYENHLDAEGAYFLEFLKEAGLEDPFAPGRIATVRKTLEEIL